MFKTAEAQVIYTLSEGDSKDTAGEERPAFIVRRWSETTVNLVVLMDGTNDGARFASCVYWATSRVYDESGKPGTWRYAS